MHFSKPMSSKQFNMLYYSINIQLYTTELILYFDTTFFSIISVYEMYIIKVISNPKININQHVVL